MVYSWIREASLANTGRSSLCREQSLGGDYLGIESYGGHFLYTPTALANQTLKEGFATFPWV